MIEIRTSLLELELREDGRTLAGRVMPYGVKARIGGYTEMFRPGAFADADPTQIPLLAVHDHESLPIGRALSLTDGPAGLDAELRVSETRTGDEVLTLVRDGAATGLSVGFIPVEDRWNATKTTVERVRARLMEISITAFPAYQDARILAVRDAGDERLGATRTPRLTVARYRV
jgi:HK97 family phage prohead protease